MEKSQPGRRNGRLEGGIGKRDPCARAPCFYIGNVRDEAELRGEKVGEPLLLCRQTSAVELRGRGTAEAGQPGFNRRGQARRDLGTRVTEIVELVEKQFSGRAFELKSEFTLYGF